MIHIPYGGGRIALDIPEGRYRMAEAAAPPPVGQPLDAFRSALAGPVRSPRLRELAAGRRVVYLVDDATRAEPHEAFIRAVFEELVGAKLVRAVVATGTHSPTAPGNQRIAAQLRAVASELGVAHEVLIHDARDPAAFEQLGVTSRGTPVEVNRRALDADLFVVSADVKNHYFAGYSNPLKNFMPGIASFRTTERNHSFALDPRASFGRHPWHPDPERRFNPVAEDMLEGALMIAGGRTVFVLASVASAAGVVWAGAGEMEAVTRLAIEQVDRAATVRVERAARLIVSPGGSPQDDTLYNAQRGLELSRNAVAEGGEILFLAACAQGVADSEEARVEFYDRLKQPLDVVIEGLEADYVLYSHKAYKFAKLLKSVRRLYMFTELDERQVQAVHMRKVAHAQDVVDEWLRQSSEPILISPHAGRTALYC